MLFVLVMSIPIAILVRKKKLNEPDLDLVCISNVILPTPKSHLQSRRYLFQIKVQEAMEVIDIDLHEGKRITKVDSGGLDRKMQNSIANSIIKNLGNQGYQATTSISEDYITITL